MNIYDIAKKSGVSIATVSRVINGSNKVSPKTYEKVKSVLKEMNFSPNQIAVGLAKNITYTVGVMVPDIRDIFHSSVAYMIESNLISKKYTSILCNTEAQSETKVEYLDMLYRKNVDGIILVGSAYNDDVFSSIYERLQKKIPMVLINAIGTKDTYSVICDETYGIKCALEHLKYRGKKYPIFIKDTQPHQINSAQTKETAFKDSFTNIYGNDIQPLTFTVEPNPDEYKSFLKSLCKDNRQVDSVICSNDTNGALFIKALTELNLKCPNDFAVVGFNNSYITEITSPSMTSIDHEIKMHCDMAVEKLFSIMKSEKVEKITYIKPKLVIKKST